MSSLPALIDFLASEPSKDVWFQGLHCVRVGRNPVWKISSSEEAYFIKFAGDDRYFARERVGLEATARLAEDHDWIMAPRILHLSAEHRALVMSGLAGESVGRLLARGFRIDRNPTRRRGRRDLFLTALESVVAWLELLHSLQPPFGAPLFDHSPGGMRTRVVRKLARAQDLKVLDISLGLIARIEQMVVPVDDPGRLVTGDASLGNFIWDEGRIGRIDFEDLGSGHPDRDLAELHEGMLAVERRPWYWSPARAADLIPKPTSPSVHILTSLEWALDRHWQANAGGHGARARELSRIIEHRLTNLPS